MTHTIKTIDELEALYGPSVEAAQIKVAPALTPLYRRWIMASRFCVVSTIGPEGADGSPRGDDGPVVQELDDKTLLLPDWRGNNRLDTLRNIVRDPRVALMFMVPGSGNVVRVNGQAVISTDPDLIARFGKAGKQPRSVAVITINEVYFQCARAIVRSGLWAGRDDSVGLPSAGDLLTEARSSFEGGKYDADWSARAAKTLW